MNVILAAVLSLAAQDEKALAPFALPPLAAVKEKCKPNEEQLPKIELIYKDAVQSEIDIRRRARESESDRKTTEKFIADGRLQVVLKIKELFIDEQDKIFDGLPAGEPAKKKKK